MALRAGANPQNLADAGWGVVFAQDAAPRLRAALGELLDHRQRQASAQSLRYYQEYNHTRAYRPGDTKQQFLARQGVAAGQPVDPNRLPYYLLLVADPETIPYRFQLQLGFDYAVGRLWFETADGEPDYEAFERYAHSVVAAETSPPKKAMQAIFFGVENPDDPMTALAARDLIVPLTEQVTEWSLRPYSGTRQEGAQATKELLRHLLGGPGTPDILFTSCHGLGFPSGSPRQRDYQGALLCQDWPGPNSWRQPIPPEMYFAADDVSADARLAGLITFHLSAYSLGTPREDSFAAQALRRQVTVAPRAFVARLPERLLGHPRGGALAVVGLTDRTWRYSFPWRGSGDLAAYAATVKAVMAGQPIGMALGYLTLRAAALFTELSTELEALAFGKLADDLAISELWAAANDAGSWAILGDPAVRLRVASPSF